MWPSFRAVPPELSAAGPFTYVGRLITCEGIFDRSPAENIKPVKAKTKDKARKQDDNKIDGIVALIMAIGLVIAKEDEPPSVYTGDRGLISL